MWRHSTTFAAGPKSGFAAKDGVPGGSLKNGLQPEGAPSFRSNRVSRRHRQRVCAKAVREGHTSVSGNDAGLGGRLVQCLLEIEEEVVEIFQPDREAAKCRAYARLLQARFVELRVRHARSMHEQRV